MLRWFRNTPSFVAVVIVVTAVSVLFVDYLHSWHVITLDQTTVTIIAFVYSLLVFVLAALRHAAVNDDD